jgi:peptide/nickel transport system substrate-binding protein
LRKFIQFGCALLLAAFASSAASAQTLRTTLNSDIRGLMPGKSPDISTGTVLQQIYEGLVAWRADGSVAPMLAKSIDVSSDGKTYTFTLREGVRFHNGAPLTAKEVVWTWNQFLDPKSAWPCRGNFNGANGVKIESVEALDEHRVAFNLARPSGAFLSAMARSDCDSAGIAHPDSVGPDGTWQKAIGTGPFKLGEWRKGQFVELVKNEDYSPRSEPPDGYAGAKIVKVDKVRLDLIPDQSAAKLALQSGRLDIWFEVDPSLLPELSTYPKVKVSVSPLSSVYALPMQTKDPVLGNPKIREAIAMAIDRAALAGNLTEGKAEPSPSLVPVSSRYYGEVEKTAPPYDPDAARRLVAEAGYKGEPIVVLTNKQNAIMEKTAVILQAMLQAVGLNATVEVVEFANQFERYYSGRYQITVWNLTPYLDPVYLFERFIGDKTKQADKVWDDPKARELLAALFNAEAPEARQKLFDDLHRLFVKDLPMLVWASRVQVAAYRDNVKGFAAWPGQKPRFWGVELAR